MKGKLTGKGKIKVKRNWKGKRKGKRRRAIADRTRVGWMGVEDGRGGEGRGG